jgi:hypothetical protein
MLMALRYKATTLLAAVSSPSASAGTTTTMRFQGQPSWGFTRDSQTQDGGFFKHSKPLDWSGTSAFQDRFHCAKSSGP